MSSVPSKSHHEHARTPRVTATLHVVSPQVSHAHCSHVITFTVLLTMERLVVDEKDEECESLLVGGKAYNLWVLSHRYKLNVPAWFAITSRCFTQFVQVRTYLYKMFISPSIGK